MISKELEMQIAQDHSLKELTNQIRLDFETRLKKDRPEAIAETEQILISNLDLIQEYLTQHLECPAGPLSECQQVNPGFGTMISYTNGRFYLSVKHCRHWLSEHQHEEMKKHFTYVDYNIDEFSESVQEYWQQLERDTDFFTGQEIQQRKDFLTAAIKKIKNPTQAKGFYLYGEPGVGKTTLLRVLANTVAIRSQKTVAYINMANLISLSKQSMNEKSLTRQRDLTSKLKEADVLFLDDIGAENVSNWSRDEVLISLLSSRMEKKKLTFFSSNFSMDELQKNYLLKKDQYVVERIKQKRFLERIRALSVEFNLAGESHRF